MPFENVLQPIRIGRSVARWAQQVEPDAPAGSIPSGPPGSMSMIADVASSIINVAVKLNVSDRDELNEGGRLSCQLI